MFDRILIEEDCVDFPVARRLADAGRRHEGTEVRVVPADGNTAEALRGENLTITQMKSIVFLTRREDFFLLEGGEGTGNPACDLEIEFAWGCPHRCAFCQDIHFLASSPYIEIYPDLERVLEVVDRKVEASEKEPLVVETGSFSDLLALEPYTGILGDLIPHWSSKLASRSQLQFITKSANVKPLLDLDPRGSIRVGFSVNLPRFTKAFALGTPPPERQRAAIQALLARGYRLHLSFSPILYRKGIFSEYEALMGETRDFLEGCEGYSASDLTLEAITFFQRKGGESLIRRHFPDQAESLLRFCEVRAGGKERIFSYGEPIRTEMRAFLRRSFEVIFPEARVLFVS
ncbi:MAG: SPL family radical SAM protein [Planctomycetota bacterium]